MKMSPEREKGIRTILSLFMDEPEAERFTNLEYAISLVKQGQPPWQALVSIGVYTAEFCVYQDSEDEKAFLHELVGQSLEPVETFFESMVNKSGKGPIEGEQARLLFHTRFALGFLSLAADNRERSKSILHDMASTRVSRRGRSYYGEGPEILEYTEDIGIAKLQAAIHLLAEYCAYRKDFLEILYFITEAVACSPWFAPILKIVPSILDNCVEEFEKTDLDGPGLEWLWLFVELGELLSLYDEYDSSDSAPSECKVESAQYMAWKIGEIAGGFAVKWHNDPFGKFQDFESAIGEKEYQSERGEEKTHQTVMAILALLREYDPARDWQKMRDQCLSIWGLSDSYSGMPLSEIGPCHDLFWAMRIGFADTFLKHHELVPGTDIGGIIKSKMWRDIDGILAGEMVERQTLSREEVLKLAESEESIVLEFKASARWDYKEKRCNDFLCIPVIKTVAAFLNGNGGRLLIGVGDDHCILGLDNDYKDFRGERDPYKRFLADKLCNHIGKVNCSKYVSIEFYNFGNKDICLLDCRPSAAPVYVQEGSSEDFYIRVENEARKLNTREANDYINLTFPRRSG